MLRFLFIIMTLTCSASANNKEKIIENLNNTENLSFEFEQNINGKIETGNCKIKYPKKIFCRYNKSNKKILVSNGKYLVIKTISSHYSYPLKKTPLYLILNKNDLINKIYNLKEETTDKSIINYTIIENNNEVNVFFDNLNYNLIGWQTKDMYQNINITFLTSIKINEKIDDDLFKLPPIN